MHSRHSVSRRVGTLVYALILVIAQVMGVPDEATAGASIAYAGLVIDYGNDAVTYALVPVAHGEIFGTELLHESGIEVETVSFGGLGEGVCRIQRVGCDPGPCRAHLCQTSDPTSPFWHYLQSTAASDWQSAPLGASGSHVRAGTVDGWFWSSDAPSAAAPSLNQIAEHLNVNLDEQGGNAQVEPIFATIGAMPADLPTASKTNVIAALALLAIVGIAGALLARHRATSFLDHAR